MYAGDCHAPGRDAAHEIRGPVDRIDHPDEAGTAFLRRVLLADDAVLRKGFRNGGAHEEFDLAVAVGDEVLVTFAFHFQRLCRAEEGHAEIACPAAEVDCELIPPGDLVAACRHAIGPFEKPHPAGGG